MTYPPLPQQNVERQMWSMWLIAGLISCGTFLSLLSHLFPHPGGRISDWTFLCLSLALGAVDSLVLGISVSRTVPIVLVKILAALTFLAVLTSLIIGDPDGATKLNPVAVTGKVLVLPLTVLSFSLGYKIGFSQDEKPAQSEAKLKTWLLILPIAAFAAALSSVDFFVKKPDPAALKQPESKIVDVAPSGGTNGNIHRLRLSDTAVYSDSLVTVSIRVNSFQKAETTPPWIKNKSSDCGLYWIANITATYTPKDPQWGESEILFPSFPLIPDNPSKSISEFPADVADNVPDSFRDTDAQAVRSRYRSEDLTPLTATGNAWYPNCRSSDEPRDKPLIGLSWYAGGLNSDNEAAQWRL